MAVNTFERTVAGRARVFVVRHDPILDRVTVEVDGALLPTKLVRRPFANLWRYTFTLEGDALEVRVRASGLRDFEVTLGAVEEAIARARFPVSALAFSFVGIPVVALVALPGPVTVRGVIGVVAGIVTTAILALVYRRS
jgi:hypothetical protein